MAKHPPCGILSCCQRHDHEYCFLCDAYPCEKYKGADASDSFITHLNQIRNFEKARDIGFDLYELELNEKVEILCYLLENYNDGRRKNFFCLAVNLLELHDIKKVMEQTIRETQSKEYMKEKSAIAVCLFQAMADERNISLRLRKK